MTTSAAEIRDPASELRKASGSLKRAHLADQLATGVFYVVSGAFVLLLIFFTLYVVWDGIQAFRPEIFSFEATGIGNQFFNTVYLVVLSLLISCPIGIMAGSQWNLFSGALAASILSLPLITATTYDAFVALPKGYKEGSLALGATHFETIWKVMLPATVGPIVTGIILAAGRGFGEAAALLYTAGMSTDISWQVWDITSPVCPLNPFRPGETLSLQVWAARTEGVGASASDTAAAASAVLMVMVLVFSIGARLVSRYVSKKTEGENS